MPITVNITQLPSLSSFHGVKNGDVDAVLSGIKRPTGSAGNFDPDWKGFYTSDQAHIAIGYATMSDEQYASGAYGKAGALLKVEFPGPVTVIEVNAEATAVEIKRELNLDVNKPMIDQLSDPAVIKSKWPGSNIVVLKRETETLDGTFEIIVPWDHASKGTPKAVARFDNIARGEDARVSYQGELFCGFQPRALGPSYVGDKICKLDWAKIRKNAHDKAKSVTSDKAFINSLPKRDKKSPASSADLTKIYDSSVKHSVMSGGHKIIHQGSFLVWAADAADVLADESASSLDKITAVVGIVPGIGDAFSLADSIEHKDAEGIVTSAVALAAFTIAQAIPVVGEIVDAALIAEAAISALVNVMSNYIQATQRPAITLPKAIAPQTKDGLTIQWRSEEDQRITLAPDYGRKVHIMAISAEKGKSALLHEFAGSFEKGYVDVEPERVIIIQDEKITTTVTALTTIKSSDGKVERSYFKCKPTSPLTISHGRPAYIRLSYLTRKVTNRNIIRPSVDCIMGGKPSGTPGHDDFEVKAPTYLHLPFYIHGTSNFFSQISYFNQGGYAARLVVLWGGKEVVTMYLAIGHTELIDLKKYKIPEGTTLQTRLDIEFKTAKVPGPNIVYGTGSGETANLKSWGTIFSPQIDFG